MRIPEPLGRALLGPKESPGLELVHRPTKLGHLAGRTRRGSESCGAMTGHLVTWLTYTGKGLGGPLELGV